MSPELISFIAFAAVALLLSISKRTRPLVVAVSALWLVGHAVYDFVNSEAQTGFLLLVVAGGISVGAFRDRKKLIAQLKG